MISCLRELAVRRSAGVLVCLKQDVHTTSVLCAEPLRKKKRMDPALLKMRVDRKIRKIEKAIRQIENAEKVLKPIMERTLAPQVFKELEVRTRDEQEVARLKQEMTKLLQVWSVYRNDVSTQQNQSIRRCLSAQQRALEELKSNWPDLYQDAIAIDSQLLPHHNEKFLTDQPANSAYVSPDGTRTECTKQWSM